MIVRFKPKSFEIDDVSGGRVTASAFPSHDLVEIDTDVASRAAEMWGPAVVGEGIRLRSRTDGGTPNACVCGKCVRRGHARAKPGDWDQVEIVYLSELGEPQDEASAAWLTEQLAAG